LLKDAIYNLADENLLFEIIIVTADIYNDQVRLFFGAQRKNFRCNDLLFFSSFQKLVRILQLEPGR